MAFEGLREQLKERWSELSDKIQETSAFNSAREKYESQTPNVQRAIIGGGIALAALILLSFPMSYISSSNESLSTFEENRELIQGLLRAASSAKEAPPLPAPLPHDALRSRIEQMVRSQQLVGDQVGEFQQMPTGGANALIPPQITRTGMAFQLKRLNVAQVVELANAVGNLGAGNKLIGMDLTQSPGQTHYYDVILKVMNYGLAVASEEEPADASPRGRGRGNTQPRNQNQNESEE